MSHEAEHKEAKILAQYATELFSTELLKKTCPNVPSVKIDVVTVFNLSDRDLNVCLQLLDNNLGNLYSSVNGKGWKSLKKKEMLEPGLIYILFRATDAENLVGFLSMKIVNEYDLCVLYLYEIQLDQACRNIGMGTFLMKQLEEVVQAVNKSGKLKKLWLKLYPEEYEGTDDPALLLTGTALTVFSVNKGARNLYQRLGYVLHPDSAKDRVLRSGKVIEPEYYMLEKKIIAVTLN